MSVDRRTRSDADASPVAAADFFVQVLPGLIRDHAGLVNPWLQQNRPEPLTLEVEGHCWQLRWQDGGVHLDTGSAPRGLHVRLSGEDFSGMVNDLYTPMTFFTGGSLDIPRGNLGDFLDWWLVLRALLDERAIHVPGAIDLLDARGNPLALDRSFSLDEPLQELREFLEAAGFLHLRSVFSEEEMAAISADMDACADEYVESDGRSWWATTGNDERRLVRMQAFDTHSPATARLLTDPRFLRLGEITGDGHVHRGLENNNIEALVKPLDVVQGISDLPWHKDCSLGRHSYDCCSLTVGISVTGADVESGQLRVIAGSHDALMWPALISKPEIYGLPVVDLPTATGDVTLHLSCTHHMAQAPVERERRVLYTGFRLPSVSVEASDASRDRISRVREGAYRTVSQ